MEIDVKEALKNVEKFASMGLIAISSVNGLVAEIEKSGDVKDKKAMSEVTKAKKSLEDALANLKKIQFGA